MLDFFSPSQTLSTPPHSLLTGPQRVVRVVEVGLGQGNVTLNSTRLLHPYIPTSSRQLRRARIFAVAAKHTLCVISRKNSAIKLHVLIVIAWYYVLVEPMIQGLDIMFSNNLRFVVVFNRTL